MAASKHDAALVGWIAIYLIGTSPTTASGLTNGCASVLTAPNSDEGIFAHAANSVLSAGLGSSSALAADELLSSDK